MVAFNYKNFPETKNFLSNTLQMLPSRKPQVFQTFMGYSLFGQAEATKVLKPGWTPIVEIRQLRGLYGFTPPSGNAIHLDDMFVEDAEDLMSFSVVTGVYDFYRNKEKAQLLLEITVMHELVHWCRQQVNGYNPKRSAEERIAQAFEIKAYGKKHTVHTVGLTQAMRDPAKH